MRVEADREALTKMQARICELENESAGGLRPLVDEAKREGADSREVSDVSRAPQLMREMSSAPERKATVTAEVAKSIEGRAPASETPYIEVDPGEVDLVRSYAATLCLPSSGTMKGSERPRKIAVNAATGTCMRCGSGDHTHEQCNAEGKAVRWGIDWRKRRKHRKRWRQVATKSMKTASGVLKGIQGRGTTGAATLTASRRLRPELKADDDTPGFSKRLQQERESNAQVAAERLHRMLQLKEVARDDSEEHRDNKDALKRKAGSGGPARPSRTDAVTAT